MICLIVCGKAGSGKDTFASMFPMLKPFALSSELKKLVRIAQTDGAKDAFDYIASRTGMFDSEVLRACQYAQNHYEPGKQRKTLQTVGQWFRNIEPDLWIRLLKEDMEIAGNPPYIITDVRYKNEFDAFKHDTPSVFIYAPRSVRIKRLIDRDGNLDLNSFFHTSETELDTFCSECDYLVNNGTNKLQSLRNKADAIIRKEGLRY